MTTAFTLYELLEPRGRRPVLHFATFEAAEAYALKIAAFYERDADNPGCADFITQAGTLYAIEPGQVPANEGIFA